MYLSNGLYNIILIINSLQFMFIGFLINFIVRVQYAKL